MDRFKDMQNMIAFEGASSPACERLGLVQNMIQKHQDLKASKSFDIVQSGKWESALTKYAGGIHSLGVTVSTINEYDIKRRKNFPYTTKVGNVSRTLEVHLDKERRFEWAKIPVGFFIATTKDPKYKFGTLTVTPQMLQEAFNQSNSIIPKVILEHVKKKFPLVRTEDIGRLDREQKEKVAVAEAKRAFGSILTKIRSDTIAGCEEDLKKAFASGKFKGYPLIFKYDTEVDDWWYKRYISFFKIPKVSDAITDYRDRIEDKNYEGVSYTASEKDLEFLNQKSDAEIEAYTSLYTQIAKKWMDKAISEMKKQKIPVSRWGWDHYTEEYFCEEVYVMLNINASAGFDSFIGEFLSAGEN